jgi:hypothetical protein
VCHSDAMSLHIYRGFFNRPIYRFNDAIVLDLPHDIRIGILRRLSNAELLGLSSMSRRWRAACRPFLAELELAARRRRRALIERSLALPIFVVKNMMSFGHGESPYSWLTRITIDQHGIHIPSEFRVALRDSGLSIRMKKAALLVATDMRKDKLSVRGFPVVTDSMLADLRNATVGYTDDGKLDYGMSDRFYDLRESVDNDSYFYIPLWMIVSPLQRRRILAAMSILVEPTPLDAFDWVAFSRERRVWERTLSLG